MQQEALGERGAQMSMRKAYMGANPYYSPFYGEYSMNCQRCVVAYEARRRGYDVMALPTYDGDILPYSVGSGNGFWMGAFRGARTTNVGSATAKATKANIRQQMEAWGDGSRAVVRVSWKGTNNGHVFNVENHKGKLYYVDAQTGDRVNINQYMSAAVPSNTRLVRTDNLRLSDRARKSISPVRK